jgi:hypothetical protein
MCTLRSPSAATVVGFSDNSQHQKMTLSSKWTQTENVKIMAAYNKTLRYYGSIQPKDICLKGCDAILLVSIF